MSTRMRRRITSAKREEIEAEQKVLEERIVRPFETLEGLPISYNEPPNGRYEDVLKNPLTIKDSAVLYNSLIRSRNTFIHHAPMFQLHWVKQTAYAKKLAEMDKEKQKEVMRERENKRRFAKATTNSLEARNRVPVLSPEVNARDVMSKLCESSISLGPHKMDIRIFIAKDSRSDKSRAFSELSKLGGAKQVTVEPEAVKVKPSENSSLGSTDVSKHKTTSVIGPQPSISTLSEEQPFSPILVQPVNSKSQPEKSSACIDVSEKPGSNVPAVCHKSSKAMEAWSSSKSSPGIKSTGSHSTSSNGSPIKLNQSKVPGFINGNARAEIRDKDTDFVDELNLRGVSQASEPKASNLPRKPVEGRADSQAVDPLGRISEPSTSVSALPVSGEQSLEIPSKDQPAKPLCPEKDGTTTDREPTARSAPANLQSIENTVMISNLNAIAKIDLSLNDLMKEVASGKASESQITRFKKYIERAKKMGPQPHHAELFYNRGLPLPPDFPRPYSMRPMAERKVQPKIKTHNPMKLTAFQEKYLHNATLVFEFLENPNVRYIIPQNSICEVLRPELPPPSDAEEGAEYNDVLLSHMWIHNSDEMDEYEHAYAHYQSELEKRKKEEIEAAKTANEDSAKIEDGLEGESPRPRALRTKKKAPPRRKPQLSPPELPHVKYTTFSFTIHNIPSRYIPIFINSMKPCEEVQERMMRILKTGTRMTSFFLWYQVDARLDEQFAEHSRNDAVAEERKMTGVLPPVEQKKRKPRDYKNSRGKRQKDNSQVVEEQPLDALGGNKIHDPNGHVASITDANGGHSRPLSVTVPDQNILQSSAPTHLPAKNIDLATV